MNKDNFVDELKPCPFCGGTEFDSDNDTGSNDESYFEWWYCVKCGHKFYDRALWNSRPIEDALRKENIELKEKPRLIP